MGNSTINDGISTGAIPKVRKVDKTNESSRSTTIQEAERSETNVKKENKDGEGSSSSGFKKGAADLKSKSLKADTDMGVFIRRKRNVSSKSDQSHDSTAKKTKIEDSPPLIRGTGSHCSRRKRHYELRMLNDEVADVMGPSTSSGYSDMKRFKRKCEKGKYPKNKRIGNKKCKSSKKVTSDDKPVKVLRKNSTSEDEDDLLAGLQKLQIGEKATPPVDKQNEMPGAEPQANAATPRPILDLDKLATLTALNSLVVIRGLPMSLIHRYRNVLTEYFQRYGHIQHIGAAKLYRDNNNVQMFATTVYFDDDKTATKALEMDNTVYDESIIRVLRLFPFMDEIEEGRRRRRAYLAFEELGIHVATNPETQEEIVIMEDGHVRYDWEYSGSDSD